MGEEEYSTLSNNQLKQIENLELNYKLKIRNVENELMQSSEEIRKTNTEKEICFQESQNKINILLQQIEKLEIENEIISRKLDKNNERDSTIQKLNSCVQEKMKEIITLKRDMQNKNEIIDNMAKRLRNISSL